MPVVSARRFLGVALPVLSAIAPPAGQAEGLQDATDALARHAPQPEFAVRVDLSQADAIAPLLARIGQPVLYPVPAGADPATALADLCGTAPPILGIVTRPSSKGTLSTYVSAAPCVRRARNVRTVARDGDTLEIMAVRLGMRPSASALLKVERAKSRLRRAMTTRLSKGDVVIASAVPDWSTVRPYPGTVTTREEMVQEVALAMKCGAENAERCIARRGVLVTDRTPSEPTNFLQSQAREDSDTGLPIAINPAAPAASAGLTSAVAAGQWPYDVNLVKLLLKESITLARGRLRSIIIGVEDNGLGSREGLPLVPATFGPTFNPPDAIGGGAPRDDIDRDGTDDVTLCNKVPPEPYGSWTVPGPEKASHGSIVSSIAVGRNIRSDDTATALPQIIFFRMVRNGCSADTALSTLPDDLVSGAEFLTRNDIQILNMSLTVPDAKATSLKTKLKELLTRANAPILIAAAGNDGVDLDNDQTLCPACLGSTERAGGIPSFRIIAVGAADRDLRRSAYSGYGKKTVRLYAPAEPLGAVDILGHDASGFKSATSYATPLVSLAAGILLAHSDNAEKIRDRLLLSTWPLLGDDGNPRGAEDGPLDLGVLDLVRVVALRHQVIEVFEQEAGHRVRRTYVGNITAGFDALCPETMLKNSDFHSIRFDQPDATGRRKALIVKQDYNSDTRNPLKAVVTCTSAGTVTMQDVRGPVVNVPAASIMQLLLPMQIR